MGLGVAALGATGCGSRAPEELPAAAGVPVSPALTAEPEGRVSPVGAEPEGIVADPGSGLAAVSLGARRELALVRISTGDVVRRVRLAGAARHLQLADADGPGTRVLVPDDAAGSLVEVALGGRADLPDAPVGDVLSRTRVGPQPEDAVQLGVSPEVAVVSRGDSTLSIVDGGRVVRRTTTGLQPGGVATIDGGRLIVVLAAKERTLELYDATSLERIARKPAGVGPTHVVCRDEGVCYVTDTTGESVLVFTWRDDELDLLRRFYLESRPYGLAIDEERERIWVTMPEDNEVLDLYARDRLKLVRTVASVQQPDAVTVDRTNGGVVVTGRKDGVLQRVLPLPADRR